MVRYREIGFRIYIYRVPDLSISGPRYFYIGFTRACISSPAICCRANAQREIEISIDRTVDSWI